MIVKEPHHMVGDREINLNYCSGAEHIVAPAQGLIVPAAFVRGIRHLGYRSSLEALAELVDNAIQAYAERVDIVCGFEAGGSTSKPSSIAVIDDGHGMNSAMMRYALMWGGTHREDDRSGLGRFGYGLPCATVSIGRRFTIYSKTRGAPLHSVALDLDLLEKGSYSDGSGDVSLPSAAPDQLPRFLQAAVDARFPGWRAGTVILIERLDRLDWTTALGLRRNAVRRFGAVYHKLLRDIKIRVDGEQVVPIDPLFLNPDAFLHAIDEDRAQALDPVDLTCSDPVTGRSGTVSLRYSWLPPTFAARDKSRDATGINANERFALMKQYHGVVFSRNGRVIDVHARTPWTTFINNDRYIRVEVEFSAALDEAFGVTTSKQQVSVSPSMWDQLQAAGLPKALEQLRAKVRSAKVERTASKGIGASAASGATSRAPDTKSLQTVAAHDQVGEAIIAARALLGRGDRGEALELLLGEIEARLSQAAPVIAGEYAALMRLWSQNLRTLAEREQNRA
jgi:hypothetical protein